MIGRLRAGALVRAFRSSSPDWLQLADSHGFVLHSTKVNGQSVELLCLQAGDVHGEASTMDEVLDGQEYERLIAAGTEALAGPLVIDQPTRHAAPSSSMSDSQAERASREPPACSFSCFFTGAKEFTADAFDQILRMLPFPDPTANLPDASHSDEPRPDEALLICRQVSRTWCHASRRLFSDPHFLAHHLPLRTLLDLGCPAAAACYRLEAFPEEAKLTHKRRTALHLAVERRAAIQVVDRLLELHPAAASATDLRAILPIHLLAQATPPKRLGGLRPIGGVGGRHANNTYALERRNGSDEWQARCAEKLLARHPLGRCLFTKDRKTALHIACEHGAPASLVEVLLQPAVPGPRIDGANGSNTAAAASFFQHPSTLSIDSLNRLMKPDLPASVLAALTGRGGANAVHFAMSNARSPRADTVAALLRACPDAARAHDRNGALPIHMAIELARPAGREAAAQFTHNTDGREAPIPRTCPAVVASLLDAYPITLSWPCVDLLRLGGLGEGHLRRKLQREPWQIIEADDDGRTLLHHAAKCNASTPLLEWISAQNLNAARTQDKEGKLPLHYALTHRPPKVKAIEALLRAYPDGKTVGFGDQPLRVEDLGG